MKDLWRWMKIEWQYLEINWWRLSGAFAISFMWIIAGLELWRGNTSDVLIYLVMIIAWKLSWKDE